MEKIRLDYILIVLITLIIVLSTIQIRSEKVMNTFTNATYLNMIN